MTMSTRPDSGTSPPSSAMGWATLPPSASRPGRRRWPWVAAAIGAAVVVTLGVLFEAGLVFHTSGGGSPSSPWETYLEAEPQAAQAAATLSGGPWSPVFAAGLALLDAITVPATNLTSVLSAINCTASFPGGVSPSVTVPATPTSAGAGRAALWVVGFRNSTGGILVSSVTEGSAAALFTAGGASCQQYTVDLLEIASDVADSPTAVGAAASAGGSAFLTQHSTASQLWVLFGGYTIGPIETAPMWTVVDSSCSLSGGGTGAAFVANESGSGVVLSSHTYSSLPCSASGLAGRLPLAETGGSVGSAAKAI